MTRHLDTKRAPDRSTLGHYWGGSYTDDPEFREGNVWHTAVARRPQASHRAEVETEAEWIARLRVSAPSLNDDPWMVNADDARVLRAEDREAGYCPVHGFACPIWPDPDEPI